MIAQIVRFQSGLSEADVRRTYADRAPRYRDVPGLLQKLYLRFADGEHGAIYLWDTPEALARFRESELARSIAAVYELLGPAQTLTGDVVLMLREGTAPRRPATT